MLRSMGVEFRLAVMDGTLRIAAPDSHCVLCNVVETIFVYGEPAIASARGGRARSFEGNVAWSFHADEPDEVGPGDVLLHYLDEEAAVPAAQFFDLVHCGQAVRSGAAFAPSGLWQAWKRGLRRIRYVVEVMEKPGPSGSGKLLATILSDGRRCSVDLCDPVHACEIADLFTGPLSLRRGGPIGERGAALGDPAPVTVAAGSLEALAHQCDFALPAIGLHGRLIAPGS